MAQLAVCNFTPSSFETIDEALGFFEEGRSIKSSNNIIINKMSDE